MFTGGAASNIVKSFLKCSSNSSIAATFPHLKAKLRHYTIYGGHKILWIPMIFRTVKQDFTHTHSFYTNIQIPENDL